MELDASPERFVTSCRAILICGSDAGTRLNLEDAIHSQPSVALIETIVGFDYETAREALQRLGLGRRRMDVVWIDLAQEQAFELLTKLSIEFEGIAFFVSGTNVEEGTGVRVQQAGYHWIGDDLTQIRQAILWRHKLNREKSRQS